MYCIDSSDASAMQQRLTGIDRLQIGTERLTTARDSAQAHLPVSIARRFRLVLVFRVLVFLVLVFLVVEVAFLVVAEDVRRATSCENALVGLEVDVALPVDEREPLLETLDEEADEERAGLVDRGTATEDVAAALDEEAVEEDAMTGILIVDDVEVDERTELDEATELVTTTELDEEVELAAIGLEGTTELDDTMELDDGADAELDEPGCGGTC